MAQYYEYDINNKTCKDSIADVVYTAPSQSLLQRWLREVHGINIHIHHEERNNWSYGVGMDFYGNNGGYQDFESYEQALEKGLQEGLKLIK